MNLSANQIRSWEQVEPVFNELIARPIDAGNVEAWLGDWSHLREQLYETYNRLYVAITVNTEDKESHESYQNFLETIYPPAMAADQKLKEKLLASGLEPSGLEVPLRNMQAESDLFREANLPLLSQEIQMSTEYDAIVGAQTVEWEGQELTVIQLRPVFQDPDRGKRERAWRLASERQLQDRQKLNELWGRLMDLRIQLAQNAGYPDYRAYRWQQVLRFDYTPEDSLRFGDAIEEVVVPVVQRINDRRKEQLSLETLRPWDLDVDPYHRPPLHPFQDVSELEAKTARIFQKVDPELGRYFETMRRERLLDLDNRKGKAPGGYCTDFPASHLPFIFANSVGLHDDVQTMLHEGGHAFHVFESSHLPYHHQLQIGAEMAEVASMSMELLASPYLTADQGGFYTPQEAARARLEHLESILRFWPYMAVVDGFQHWAYTHPAEAVKPERCDGTWASLWRRFMPGVDWGGLEDVMDTGWQRKLHIFQSPFYYVEYGMAQLGALQIWRNARQDQPGAVAAYRRALSLGGTLPLPDLYAAAGARFAFDASTLRSAVSLIEEVMEELKAYEQ